MCVWGAASHSTWRDLGWGGWGFWSLDRDDQARSVSEHGSKSEGWSGRAARPAGEAGGRGGSDKGGLACAGSPQRRGAERGRPLPSTQEGHLCAALPGCHRNEQRAVGGWGRRRVGKGEAGAWGRGAGSRSSGAVASRARARRRGPRGRSPEPGARRPPRLPPRGSESPPVPSLVPSGAQVGDGDLEEPAWRAGPSAPPSCWPHLVASVQVRGAPGARGLLSAPRWDCVLSVCRVVTPPLYLLPRLHHRCDSVELPHSPEAVGSGRLTTVLLRSPRRMPDREGGQAGRGVRLALTPALRAISGHLWPSICHKPPSRHQDLGVTPGWSCTLGSEPVSPPRVPFAVG